MDQPITVKLRFSVDDLIEGYRCHFRHSCRPAIRFGLHCIFAILLLGGLGGVLTYPKARGVSLAWSIGSFIVGVYWFALLRYERRWWIRRQYAKRPDRDIEVEWTIAADKISERDGLSYLESSWEQFIKTVRTPSGLMLYQLPQLFHYLPRRGFASDAEFERAIELAKSKVQKSYHVK